MSWDDVIQCMACPGASFTDREVYAGHVKTKWHLYNTNRRMMGNPTLSAQEYLEKFGDPDALGSVAKDLCEHKEKKQEEAPKEEEKPPEPEVDDLATVVVIFVYQEEKWSHKFSVKKGSTIWDLKKVMVKPDSPEEDVLSFSLKTGMIRAWNFETIDSDETYEFQYIGPEEGQKFLDRDKARKQRDEDEIRERQEEEQRKIEERKRQEEEREMEEKRRQEEEEERKRQEAEAEKRRQEEEEAARRWWEEEEARRRQEEEEARRRQEEEEAERRRQEEEAERQRQEEEAERQRQEEEAERQRQEEAARLEQERQAEEQAQAQANGGTVEVSVHIDRALGFQTTLSLAWGARVRELKQRLAEDDPTGMLRPQDLGLVDSSGRELGDDEQIKQPIEVDLKTG